MNMNKSNPKKKKATHKKLTNLLLSGDIVKRFGYNQKYI
jgi:hypothetical protein